MQFWSTNWGDIITVVGVVVSLIGLTWAIIEAHKAKTSSRAAESTARQTRDQMARHLQAVDLQRAIGLIERIKTFHDNNRWEASRAHYQTLRAMLSDVIARCPSDMVRTRERLATARTIMRDMEDFVRSREGGTISKRDRTPLDRRLNEVQSDLEELASNLGFGDEVGGMTWST